MATEARGAVQAVDSEQEHRLAAIMNADVVGYSRLMAQDEDATVRMVTFYRQEVGRVVGAQAVEPSGMTAS